MSEEYITVSPFIRCLNHSFAGITEASRVAVRINKKTMEVDYEPTNLWIKRAASAVLMGVTMAAVLYRSKRLEQAKGMTSLAGASRPFLHGVAWATGAATALNMRPVTPSAS